jgi:hypothetical protein
MKPKNAVIDITAFFIAQSYGKRPYDFQSFLENYM